jgi:hypothetical protein
MAQFFSGVSNLSGAQRRALGAMRIARPAPRAAFRFQRFLHEGQTRRHHRVPERFARELLARCTPCSNLVCDRKMSLTNAQRCIALNWVVCSETVLPPYSPSVETVFTFAR